MRIQLGILLICVQVTGKNNLNLNSSTLLFTIVSCPTMYVHRETKIQKYSFLHFLKSFRKRRACNCRYSFCIYLGLCFVWIDISGKQLKFSRSEIYLSKNGSRPTICRTEGAASVGLVKHRYLYLFLLCNITLITCSVAYTPVSYTHLDVYKRQRIAIVC